MGWNVHWGLNRDPFLDRGGPYVPLPGHEEAVARLVHTIEAGHRLAVLSAPAGMGKTRVLGRALAEARHPCRRFALASSPMDGSGCCTPGWPRAGIAGVGFGEPRRRLDVHSSKQSGSVPSKDFRSCWPLTTVRRDRRLRRATTFAGWNRLVRRQAAG